MMRILSRYGIILLAALLISTGAYAKTDREVMFQVSTLDGLMAGLYDGLWPFNQLRSHGDFGLGTFDKLDGEMIALDGKFYRVSIHGKVNVVPGKETTPFACVTYFDRDGAIEVPVGTDMASFTALLDSKLPTLNVYEAIRVDGTFIFMKTRSVSAQTKPYPPLSEATAKQAVFEFREVKGTIVGIRGPYYVRGQNLPGYHFHFITTERTAGGHVLDFTAADVKAIYDETRSFTVVVPQGAAFDKAEFNVLQPAAGHVE